MYFNSFCYRRQRTYNLVMANHEIIRCKIFLYCPWIVAIWFFETFKLFRFVELHFSELPSSELCYIIEKRCKIATKAAKKLIAVMHDLQVKYIDMKHNNWKLLVMWQVLTRLNCFSVYMLSTKIWRKVWFFSLIIQIYVILVFPASFSFTFCLSNKCIIFKNKYTWKISI